jgi:ABC-type multidrug transport system fused ATPase/permease subunit
MNESEKIEVEARSKSSFEIRIMGLVGGVFFAALFIVLDFLYISFISFGSDIFIMNIINAIITAALPIAAISSLYSGVKQAVTGKEEVEDTPKENSENSDPKE